MMSSLLRSDDSFLSRLEKGNEVEALEVLEAVSASVGDLRPRSWEDCVRWARLRWETLYNHDIRQLLHCFPPDAVKQNSETPLIQLTDEHVQNDCVSLRRSHFTKNGSMKECTICRWNKAVSAHTSLELILRLSSGWVAYWPLGGDVVYVLWCWLPSTVITDSTEPPPMPTVKDETVVDPRPVNKIIHYHPGLILQSHHSKISLKLYISSQI